MHFMEKSRHPSKCSGEEDKRKALQTDKFLVKTNRFLMRKRGEWQQQSVL